MLHRRRIRMKNVSPFLATKSVGRLDCAGGNTSGYNLTVQIQHQTPSKMGRQAGKRGWSGSN
jgi:hypothetical protein